MKQLGIILLGCCLSVLSPEPSAAVITTPSCEVFIPTLEGKSKDEMCKLINSFENLHPGSQKNPCTDEYNKLLEPRSNYSETKHNALLALTTKLCNGVRKAGECQECFLYEFGYLWNQDVCLVQYAYRTKGLTQCLYKHRNPTFALTRKVIEEVRYKSPVFVNIYGEEYSACQFSPDIVPKNGEIVLNLFNQWLKPEYFIVDLLLAMFLDAIRIQKGESSVSVTCEHIQDLELLTLYKQQTGHQAATYKSVPKEVSDSFRNLRVSMCSESDDEETCQKCFTEADEMFAHHIFNFWKIRPVERDFVSINATLTNCINTYAKGKYSKLTTYIRDSEDPYTWKKEFYNCSDTQVIPWATKAILNIIATVKGFAENDALVKSVAANYFAFYLYQKHNEHKKNVCDDIHNSKILCVAVQAIESVTILRTHLVADTKDEIYFTLNNIYYCRRPDKDMHLRKNT